MEANELRLGNYIKFPHNNKPLLVHTTIIEYCLDDNKMYEPISLTEEWLLEFGFNYRDAKYWIDGLCIHTSDKDFYILQEQGRVFIKSVHQLQNLFFALKGKELTIVN